MAGNYPPYHQPMVDSDGKITDPWLKYFLGQGGAGGPAPAGGSFVTTGVEPALPSSRVLSDSTSVKVDLATPAQVALQRAALTGDVTAAQNSNATVIANDAVTYAKMQNVSAASRLLGRGSGAGSGDVEEITLGATLSMSGTVLDVASGSVGLVKKQSKSLTDNDIKNLGAGTAVQIATALGANIILLPLWYIFKAYVSAGAYTGLTNGGYFQINYDNGAAELASAYIPNDSGQTPILTLLTDLIGTTINRVLKLSTPFSFESDPLATQWGNIDSQNTMDVQNKNLVIDGFSFAGAFGGGNAANHLDIDTYYLEVPI